MDNFDLEMRLLAGKPIEINGSLRIHKVSFDTICDIGYIKYNNIVGLLCTSDYKIRDFLNNEEANVYRYIITLSYYAAVEKDNERVEFLSDLILVFKSIFNSKDVKFDLNNMCFIVDDAYLLNENNFDEFVRILKIRNCIEDIETVSDNPDSERTRQLLERRKQLRDKLKKTKTDEAESEINILDLISIFAESSNMKLEDVFQYDTYQFLSLIHI